MTKHQFKIEDKEITSLVMTTEEFSEFCNQLEQIKQDQRSDWKKQIKALREAEHVPMIGRGTATEFLFTKYEVTTNLLTACVRGFATRGTVSVERETAIEVIQKAYDGLSKENKEDVDATALAVFELLKTDKPQDVQGTLTRFVGKHMKEVDRGFRLAFLEDLLKSLSATMLRRKLDLGDIFGQDFDGYLRRLLTGVISAAEVFKKASDGN